MKNKKTIISLAAVIAVAAGIFGIAAMSKQPSATTSPETTDGHSTVDETSTVVTTTPVTNPSSSGTSTNEYKDGTYTATGSYRSPGGPDNIGVTVTLKNDIVAAVSIVPMPHDPTSKEYQAKFASGYQSLVLGKDISSVHLDAVSGSSLTPIGFNDAIAQIKAKAKS